MRKRNYKTPRRQRGVAVITALLLTTLAVSIVASLFWQQQVQVRTMENQRLQLQTQWILRGALDWARLVLRQDAHDFKGYTAMDQVWATPLAETRLDQYIERERVEGEVFNATLQGSIVDATSRYNLRNLADNGRAAPEQVAVFRRLLQNLQLDPALADRAALFVAAGQPVLVEEQQGEDPETPGTVPAGPAVSGAPMKLIQVEDLLAVPGFTPAMLDKLRPFVVVLPDVAPVNVNTAEPEVLAALMRNYSVSEANALVARRKQAPWRDMANFTAEIGEQRAPADGTADVKSEWFLINSQIKLDRAALHTQALVQRSLGGPTVGRGQTSVKWIRQN